MPTAPAATPIIQSFLISFAFAVALVPVARLLSIRLDVVARPRSLIASPGGDRLV